MIDTDKIFSHVKRPEKIYKQYSTETKTEPRYISTKDRITKMLQAGERLERYRQGLYDFPNGEIDESFTDPTRKPGYDMADAHQDAMLADENLKAAKAEAELIQKKEKENDLRDTGPVNKDSGVVNDNSIDSDSSTADKDRKGDFKEK
jgi:hypothetical protein